MSRSFEIYIITADERIVEAVEKKISELFKNLNIRLDRVILIPKDDREILEKLLLSCTLQLVLSQYHYTLSPSIAELEVPEELSYYFFHQTEVVRDGKKYIIHFVKSSKDQISIPFNKKQLDLCIANALIFPNYIFNLLVKEKDNALEYMKGLINEIHKLEESRHKVFLVKQLSQKEKLVNDISRVVRNLNKVSKSAVAKALGKKRQTFDDELKRYKIRFDKINKKFIDTEE